MNGLSHIYIKSDFPFPPQREPQTRYDVKYKYHNKQTFHLPFQTPSKQGINVVLMSSKELSQKKQN